MLSVQCAVFSVHCTVYIVQCTVCSVQCSVCNGLSEPRRCLQCVAEQRGSGAERKDRIWLDGRVSRPFVFGLSVQGDGWMSECLRPWSATLRWRGEPNNYLRAWPPGF